jgi:hypothetical protein
MAKDHGRGREERGREEEEHTHRMLRRVSRRHGGAVPARPARCYPRKPSPCHHWEHHNRRFHRRAHLHPGSLREASWASGTSRRGVDFRGDREANLWVRSSPGSPRRGDNQWIHLVELEGAPRRAARPRWRRQSSPEPAEIAGRWRGWLGFARGEFGRERGR